MNTAAHRTGSPMCGHQPGKEPPQLIDRAVLVAIHHQAAVPTAIRALPERHGLRVPAPAAGLARMAFILDFQHFPSENTLVGEHLDKLVQTPIVVHAAMQGFLMLGVLLGDHLPLLKMSDHHSPFNQFVSDEMGGLVQTVTALVALFL